MRNSTQSGRLARKVYLFLLPSLAGTAVFVLLPYVDVIRRSFFEAAGGRGVTVLLHDDCGIKGGGDRL